MKLHVKNCGAIGEGSIDLSKRITLLCGENGTGKTYFSYMVYGLLQTRFHVKSDEKIVEKLINNKTVDFPIDYKKIMEYRKNMLESAKENVDSIFGISTIDAKKIFKGLQIDFLDSDEEASDILKKAKIEKKAKVQGIQVVLSKNAGADMVNLKIIDNEIPSDALISFNFLLFSFVYYTLSVYPLSGVEVFPVERNSIYTFSKELSIRKQEAWDNLQMLVDKERKVNNFDIFFNSKRYPWPVRDGLMVAEDLVEKKKSMSPYYDFAEEIENDLLHGVVQVSNDGEIQFKPLKSTSTVLPIQMTASVVKTLSSLVVYLKYIAHENDLIIIDEPEINLHPDNQIVIARILVKLANKGFRLLVSTHSDYVIREFNNMVMMSQLKNKDTLLHSWNYSKEEMLNPKILAVYTFKYKTKRSKRVVIEPIEVSETGFSVKSIDRTIEFQNSVGEELFYLLKYTDDENENT